MKFQAKNATTNCQKPRQKTRNGSQLFSLKITFEYMFWIFSYSRMRWSKQCCHILRWINEGFYNILINHLRWMTFFSSKCQPEQSIEESTVDHASWASSILLRYKYCQAILILVKELHKKHAVELIVWFKLQLKKSSYINFSFWSCITIYFQSIWINIVSHFKNTLSTLPWFVIFWIQRWAARKFRKRWAKVSEISVQQYSFRLKRTGEQIKIKPSRQKWQEWVCSIFSQQKSASRKRRK